MKLKQRIKQFFCRHAYNNNTPKHATPFLGWMFQCPKCQGYVAYFKEWDDFANISEKQYEIFREEGEKLYSFFEYKEANNDRF